MSAAKKGAVAVRSEAVEVSEREVKARAILTNAILEMARPEQSALEMALAVMDADSDDKVFGSTVIHLGDIIGQPFTINHAWLTDSDYTEGLPAFAIIEAEMDDGQSVVITCGGVNIVAALINFHARKRFPIRVDTMEDGPTKNGFYVKKFIRPTTEKPTQAQLQSF